MARDDVPRRRICVFCGSRAGARPSYLAAAGDLAEALVERDVGLVFGGGNIGLMGRLADAVLARQGHAIGVIPAFLSAREIAHTGLADLRVVASMHERKAVMASLADAFIVLPGGMGTFEETTEVLTWAQLGLHAKPLGLLDVEGYFDGFVAQLERAVADGFVSREVAGRLILDVDVRRLVDRVLERAPSAAERRVVDARRV
jgi:uncharacterized protein (TIGR00730 family)